MHFKPVSLFASALWVLGATGAGADGRIELTSAELDDVTPVAGYAPAEVGVLREPSIEDPPDRERRRRQLAREVGHDPARPAAIGDQVRPAMAETPPPPVTSAPPTSAPADPPAPPAFAVTQRPDLALRDTLRQARPEAAPMSHLVGGRRLSPGQ